jgi:hypothetical protein
MYGTETDVGILDRRVSILGLDVSWDTASGLARSAIGAGLVRVCRVDRVEPEHVDVGVSPKSQDEDVTLCECCADLPEAPPCFVKLSLSPNAFFYAWQTSSDIELYCLLIPAMFDVELSMTLPPWTVTLPDLHPIRSW